MADFIISATKEITSLQGPSVSLFFCVSFYFVRSVVSDLIVFSVPQGEGHSYKLTYIERYLAICFLALQCSLHCSLIILLKLLPVFDQSHRGEPTLS